MAVKRYNPETNSWEIFPGTAGDDAYVMAQINGYKGSKEDYVDCLVALPHAVWAINNAAQGPIKDSSQLITAGGVWSAIDNLRKEAPNIDLSSYYTRDEIHELLVVTTHNGEGDIPAGVVITDYNKSYVDLAEYNGKSVPYSYIISKVDIDDWEAYQAIYKIGDWSKTATSYTYKINWTLGGILVERIANIAKQNIDPNPPSEDPDTEQYTVDISGQITYKDGSPYVSKDINVTFIGSTNEYFTSTTDGEGYINISRLTNSIPMFIRLQADDEIKEMEGNRTSINFDTWRLSAAIPTYITRGRISYKDGAPLSNKDVRVITTAVSSNVTTNNEGEFEFVVNENQLADNNCTLIYNDETKTFNVAYINNERDLGVWYLNQYSETPAIIAQVIDTEGSEVNDNDLLLVYSYTGYATEVTHAVSITNGELYFTTLEDYALNYGITNIDIRNSEGISVLDPDVELPGPYSFNPHVDLGQIKLNYASATSNVGEGETPTTGPTDNTYVEPSSLGDVVGND